MDEDALRRAMRLVARRENARMVKDRLHASPAEAHETKRRVAELLKHQIRQREIADLLGISADSVKSIAAQIRRQSAPAQPPAMPPGPKGPGAPVRRRKNQA